MFLELMSGIIADVELMKIGQRPINIPLIGLMGKCIDQNTLRYWGEHKRWFETMKALKKLLLESDDFLKQKSLSQLKKFVNDYFIKTKQTKFHKYFLKQTTHIRISNRN